MIAPARRSAFQVLRAVAGGRIDLPDALARARRNLEDERDRALLVELAAGTLRWQLALDHVIQHASKWPLARLDPEIRDLLRLGAYQLLHADRIPAAAAVDDAVSLTRSAGKASAAGFVNAVLRRISRTRHHLPLPPRPSDLADRDAVIAYLSVTCSHPRWLIERWVDRVGFEATERWVRFNNQPAAVTLRANTLRITRGELAQQLDAAGVETRPTRFAPDGLTVVAGQARLSSLKDGGLFVTQDEASQLVGVLAAAAPGSRVLDACAAPGGKTLEIAAALGDRGLIVAADVRPRRVRLLRQAVSAAGAARVAIMQLDLMQPLPFAALFDVVLVDAPCSGLGIIHRDPEIRWRRVPDDLPRLAEAQHEMLGHAARVVRPGGRLIYSTCSSEPDENERVVSRFLADHPVFVRAGRDTVVQLLPQPARQLVDDAGDLHTWPWRDELDAFFAAVLVPGTL